MITLIWRISYGLVNKVASRRREEKKRSFMKNIKKIALLFFCMALSLFMTGCRIAPYDFSDNILYRIFCWGGFHIGLVCIGFTLIEWLIFGAIVDGASVVFCDDDLLPCLLLIPPFACAVLETVFSDVENITFMYLLQAALCPIVYGLLLKPFDNIFYGHKKPFGRVRFILFTVLLFLVPEASMLSLIVFGSPLFFVWSLVAWGAIVALFFLFNSIVSASVKVSGAVKEALKSDEEKAREAEEEKEAQEKAEEAARIAAEKRKAARERAKEAAAEKARKAAAEKARAEEEARIKAEKEKEAREKAEKEQKAKEEALKEKIRKETESELESKKKELESVKEKISALGEHPSSLQILQKAQLESQRKKLLSEIEELSKKLN